MHFKKIINIFFIIYALLSISCFCIADDRLEENSITEINDIIQTTANTADSEPVINSRSAVLYERTTGRVLFGKNENEKRKMASTTKIITAIIVIENSNLNEIVEVSKKASSTGGSRLGLTYNCKITVNDLLYGLLLCSGNDCAVALAEQVSGTVDNFATLMNKKANELGLDNTHFVTPHGLDADEHYTTALEMAKLTDYALNNEIFRNIVGTKTYTVTINNYTKKISNTNELLGCLNGVYGVKTGFTNGANRCLVTATKRDNLDVICVVLGADTKKDRTKDSINLIEYAFKNYKLSKTSDDIDLALSTWKQEATHKIHIEKSNIDVINLKFDEYNTKEYVLMQDGSEHLNVNIQANYNFIAPVDPGTIIGSYQIIFNNTILETGNIYIENYIPRKNVKYYLESILNQWFY